MYIQKNILRK